MLYIYVCIWSVAIIDLLKYKTPSQLLHTFGFCNKVVGCLFCIYFMYKLQWDKNFARASSPTSLNLFPFCLSVQPCWRWCLQSSSLVTLSLKRRGTQTRLPCRTTQVWDSFSPSGCDHIPSRLHSRVFIPVVTSPALLQTKENSIGFQLIYLFLAPLHHPAGKMYPCRLLETCGRSTVSWFGLQSCRERQDSSGLCRMALYFHSSWTDVRKQQVLKQWFNLSTRWTSSFS